MTSRNRTRTVSLRRARLSRAGAVVMAFLAFVLLFLCLGLGSWSGVFFAAVALAVSAWRSARWSRAIRRALTSPDAMHWTP